MKLRLCFLSLLAIPPDGGGCSGRGTRDLQQRARSTGTLTPGRSTSDSSLETPSPFPRAPAPSAGMSFGAWLYPGRTVYAQNLDKSEALGTGTTYFNQTLNGTRIEAAR